jgi:hypothetical protein
MKTGFMMSKASNRIEREGEKKRKVWMRDFEEALALRDPSFKQRVAGKILWDKAHELFNQKYTPRFAAALYIKKCK